MAKQNIITAQKLLDMIAWHSVRSHCYHTSSQCTSGDDIEPENYRSGTGNKRQCGQCTRLARSA